MNTNDEFENLIHSFKLDDLDDSADKAAANTRPATQAPKRPATSAPQRPATSAPQRPATAQSPMAAAAQRLTSSTPRQASYQNTGMGAVSNTQRTTSTVNTSRIRTDAQRPPESRYSQSARTATLEPPAARRGAPQDGEKRQHGRFDVNIDEKAYLASSGGAGGGGDDDDDYDVDDGGSAAARWIKALVVLVAALSVSVFLAFFALASASDMFGLNKQDKEIVFTLPEGGLTMSELSKQLEDKGVITQPLTFQLYAALKKRDPEKFLPGEYELNSNMSYEQILICFASQNIRREEVTITFYEGYTFTDIADELERQGVCKKQDLIDFLDRGEFTWEYKFLEQVPDSDERYHRFEGYFFPDTYTFYVDEDVATVVQKFFVNTNAKLTDSILERMEKMELTIDQTLTLASIIQKEGGLGDMALISSVFHNRLASSDFPRLESDVTVFYVEEDIKPYLGGTQGKRAENDPHQNIYDAYNTYVCTGLPIGPICNPGLDAINAALNPEQTSYLFFIADKEGVCHYATTLAEHQQNIVAAELLGDAHGTGTGIATQQG